MKPADFGHCAAHENGLRAFLADAGDAARIDLALARMSELSTVRLLPLAGEGFGDAVADFAAGEDGSFALAGALAAAFLMVLAGLAGTALAGAKRTVP